MFFLRLSQHSALPIFFILASEGLATPVKALQGPDLLDVSGYLWMQGSVVQWFDNSDEGASPS